MLLHTNSYMHKKQAQVYFRLQHILVLAGVAESIVVREMQYENATNKVLQISVYIISL